MVAVAAVAVLASVAAATLLYPRPAAIEAGTTYTTILPPADTSFDFLRTAGPAALSPDGRSLVFTALAGNNERQLWIRALDSTEPVPLPGTTNARFPFWSPDSRWVGFFADGYLKKIDTRGGAPVSLTALEGGSGVGGTWSEKGRIIFSSGMFAPLMTIPAEGGSATVAAQTDVAGNASPWFLPDGEHFLFVSWPGSGRATLRVGSLASTDSKALIEVDSNAIYAGGRLLYLRGDALVAQPFDADALRISGEAMLVAEPVQRLGGLVGTGVFSASRTGLLTYQRGIEIPGSQLTWIDRDGNAAGTLGEAKPFFDVRLSPDGKALLASAPDAVGNYDLWKIDLVRGLTTRFTTDAGGEYYGVWSADGRTVYFNSTRSGHYDLYRVAAEGGVEELLLADDTEKVPTSVSKDGRELLYYTGGKRFQIWRMPLVPDKTGVLPRPEPLHHSTFNEVWAQFSPDDRWIAYQSDESGNIQVHAALRAEPARKYRISSRGGQFPRWRADGRAILYADPYGQLQEAQLRIEADAMEVTHVAPVFSRIRAAGGYPYDLTVDGNRALVAVPVAEPPPPEPLTLVDNWTAIRR